MNITILDDYLITAHSIMLPDCMILRIDDDTLMIWQCIYRLVHDGSTDWQDYIIASKLNQ